MIRKSVKRFSEKIMLKQTRSQMRAKAQAMVDGTRDRHTSAAIFEDQIGQTFVLRGIFLMAPGFKNTSHE
jgi:hypothetical protein